MRFGKHGKLNPRYIRRFEIMGWVGTIAYKLALPPDLAQVHNIFHVSMLRKYLSDPSHIIHHEPVDLQKNLSLEKLPVEILGYKELQRGNRLIPLIKVRLSNHFSDEATLEREADLRERYP